MVKRFRNATVMTVVLGIASRVASHLNAQVTKAEGERVGARDLTRILDGLEEESYRAWQSKDTKFWSIFLSNRFVGWGSSGRINKAAAAREWSGTDCNIVSYQISDSQLSQLTPEAVVITHKTTIDGSCGGHRLPNARWTATAYALEGAQWKAIFRAASAIIDPAKLPKQTVDTTAAGKPEPDSNTKAMLSRE